MRRNRNETRDRIISNIVLTKSLSDSQLPVVNTQNLTRGLDYSIYSIGIEQGYDYYNLKLDTLLKDRAYQILGENRSLLKTLWKNLYDFEEKNRSIFAERSYLDKYLMHLNEVNSELREISDNYKKLLTRTMKEEEYDALLKNEIRKEKLDPLIKRTLTMIEQGIKELEENKSKFSNSIKRFLLKPKIKINPKIDLPIEGGLPFNLNRNPKEKSPYFILGYMDHKDRKKQISLPGKNLPFLQSPAKREYLEDLIEYTQRPISTRLSDACEMGLFQQMEW